MGTVLFSPDKSSWKANYRRLAARSKAGDFLLVSAGMDCSNVQLRETGDCFAPQRSFA